MWQDLSINELYPLFSIEDAYMHMLESFQKLKNASPAYLLKELLLFC